MIQPPADGERSFQGLAAMGPAERAQLRAGLARMSERQLHRFLIWLDQRGAPLGKTFAVHQADPNDPGSRDLVELEVRGLDRPRPRRKLRLSALGGRRFGARRPDTRPPQAAPVIAFR